MDSEAIVSEHKEVQLSLNTKQEAGSNRRVSEENYGNVNF